MIKKKGKRRIFKCFLFLLVIALLGIEVVLVYDHDELKNDFYEEVNRDVLGKDLIEEGEYTWSTFTEAQDKSDVVLDTVVANVINGELVEIDPVIREKMKVVYQDYLNQELRDRTGILPLQGYLDGVMGSRNMEELVKQAIVVEEELGIDIFTRVEIGEDYLDNNQMIVYFYPVTFSFGTSADYWVDEDYMAYKAYIKRAMKQLLKVYGYGKAEAVERGNRLVQFYEDVSRHSKMSDELQDVGSYYHKVTFLELQTIYSSLDMRNYLEKKGILEEDFYSIVDEGQYQWLNSYLTEEHLDLWKDFVCLKILESYAYYASSEYVEVVEELNQSLLGRSGSDSKKEEARDLLVGLFSQEMNYLYEKEILMPEQKQFIVDMVDDIKEYYLEKFDQYSSFSEGTIEKGKEKIQKMTVRIGGNTLDDSVAFDYSIVSSTQGGSFLEQVIEIGKVRRERDLIRLVSNEKELGVTESVVNAYYDPLSNSIIVPVAAMFLFDTQDDYYRNLGSIGMVLAHEVTHAFDANGSQFDAEGNWFNWWTEEDRDHFEELKDRVIDYYSGYEVMAGKYIDGALTVNENIADLGAVTCIVGLAQKRGASEEELRDMFDSFASLWASQETEEYTRLLLLQDPHAPSKYRVNAVLSSIDEFYQVYGIHFWNDMYVRQEDRVFVW